MKDFNDYHTASTDKQIFKRIWQYLKPHKKPFIGSFLLMIITVFGDVALPLIFGISIDYMVSDATFSQKVTALIIGAVVIIGVLVATQVIAYYQQLILQKIGFKVTQQMRNEVFNHIESLSIGQINELPIGKLVTRVANDPNSISDMFTNVIVNMVRSIVIIVVTLVILYVTHWKMALIVTAFFPFVVIGSVLFQKYSRKTYRKVRNNISDVNAFLSENLSGMKITQVFNQEDKKIKEFNLRNEKLRKSYVSEILLFGLYRPFIFLVAMLASIATIYFGVQAVLNTLESGQSGTVMAFGTALSVGSFISFYTYVGQIFEPIQQMSEQFNAMQNGFSSAEKVFDVLDTKPDIEDCVGAIELKSFEGSIEFKDVWFSYMPDEWILKGISFKVNPDETVAFVGATGSGKTTILSLIVRNYDIQKGQILIDGIDIRKIKRSSLRKHIGQMMQDVFLFSGTIKDNITLYDESITDEAVYEAAEYVGLSDVIHKFNDGYYHQVLERGNNFSSGERQLISFARAVVYRPTLMILDEATANIDSETEAIIQNSLEKMMNVSTMLIVAHRLSTIQHADKIVVMQKGEIKEIGSHQNLLKQKGIYYHLYQLQFDAEIKNEGE